MCKNRKLIVGLLFCGLTCVLVLSGCSGGGETGSTNGGSTSDNQGNAAPRIDSLSPNSGSGGVTVTITGKHLAEVIGVTFDSVAAGTPTIISDTQITTIVPKGAATGPVVAIHPDHGLSNEVTFTISWNMPTPDQTGIDPDIGTYHFSHKGAFYVVEESGKKFVRFASDGYRFDRIEIINGSFHNEWGLGATGGFPTDAYALSGSFITKTKAEGLVKYGYDNSITSEGNFTAEFNTP